MPSQNPNSPGSSAAYPFLDPNPFSHLSQNAGLLFPDPSVIVSLSRTSPIPLTYNKKGMIESPKGMADMFDVTAPSVTPAIVDAKPDIVELSLPVARAVPMISAQEDTPQVAEVGPPISNNIFADSIIQAQANIARNPAYSNSVAGLLVKIASLRSRQNLASTKQNSASKVQPV